jgi:hypothetical protein
MFGEAMVSARADGERLEVVSGSSMRSAEEEAAAFSLLAARVASTAERAAHGLRLTRQDHAILSIMRDRLQVEAAAVKNASKPRSGLTEPTSAVAAGFTVDVVLRQTGKTKPSDQEMVKILVQLAHKLDVVAGTSDKSVPRYIAKLFRTVSSLARTQAGDVGERVVGLETMFA